MRLVKLPTEAARIRWQWAVASRVLPAVALLLTCGTGLLKWHDASVRNTEAVQVAAVRAATEGTVALLSYKPGSVETDVASARAHLTGQFLDAYTSLTHDVVIPGAKQRDVSAVATVPASAPISSSAGHAAVMLFVNQSIIVGKDAPMSTASTVRVSLDKVAGRWLISGFEPV